MRYAGVLPEDAPDPRLEQLERLKLMPVPAMGFVGQPSLEDHDQVSVNSTTRTDHTRTDGETATEELIELSATVSYQLWRNPQDHSDPANLADLDERVAEQLDSVPPWPRPAWLVERVERMRYRCLGQAVRTTWRRDGNEADSLTTDLVAHASYVLMNQFRLPQAGPHRPGEVPWPRIDERAINHAVSVRVDGEELPAAEFDTDPEVYAIGTELPSGAILTAVIPRDELEHVRIEFATRT